MAVRTVIVAAATLLALAMVLAVSRSPAQAGRMHANMAGPIMGPEKMTSRPTFTGYYDGHKDLYLSTDTSSKSAARSMHVNYSAAIGKASASPAIYLVQGTAAARQLAVFGSEPGESDYSPLWQEYVVQWKSGIKPVLLVRDDQIKSLAHKGKLTLKKGTAVLNCPIVKVGS
jgi:hypothetical protein